MSNILEIIIFFIKDYIDVILFEKWIYEKSELENLLGNELYLEVISTDFINKEEVVHLKNILKKYLIEEKKANLDELNDAYCEKFFNKSNINEFINDMLNTEKQVYKALLEEFAYPIYHKEVVIDLTNIKTERELMGVLSKKLGFYRFPMDWSWFEEYLLYSELPADIKILGIENIRRSFAGCYYLLKSELDKISRVKGCNIQYIME